MVNRESTFLFIGDSITENGRFEDPRGLGIGYVSYIQHYMDEHHSTMEWTCLNRGISGNCVTDLEGRWEKDVLAIKADYVSISIGINDVWRQLKQQDNFVSITEFEEVYERLLQTLTNNEYRPSIVLLTPSIIEEDSSSIGNQLLKAYVHCVEKLASTFGAILVPIHEEFIRALQQPNPPELTVDGVHLTEEGDELFARMWLHTLNLIK